MPNEQSSANTNASERASTNNATTKLGRPLGRPWLRRIRDHDGQITYPEIPERVRVVRWIFDEYLKGYGDYAISQRIPARYRPFGKSKHWHPNTIRRILTHPAVLGNDLFPAVIGRDQYNRAQDIRRTRDATRSARKGKKATTNLLSGLAFCAYCFSRMAYRENGSRRRPELVCSAGSRGYGCGIAKAWRYSHIEKTVLRFVEVRLAELMRTNHADKTKLIGVKEELEVERNKVRQQMDRYLKLTATNPNLTYVAEQLAPLRRQLDEFDRRLRKTIRLVAELEREKLAFNRQEDEVKEAIAKLQTDDHRRLFESRSEVHARLKRVIKYVFVAVAGARLSEDKEEEDEFDGERQLLIASKDGSQLHLVPNMRDPYDVSGWGLAESNDAGEVFPDF
jgi:recombinase/recombinase-like zinc beta ribbon protein